MELDQRFKHDGEIDYGYIIVVYEHGPWPSGNPVENV